MCVAAAVLARTAPATMDRGPAERRASYIASSGKKVTQFVCIDAPSATMVAPHT